MFKQSPNQQAVIVQSFYLLRAIFPSKIWCNHTSTLSNQSSLCWQDQTGHLVCHKLECVCNYMLWCISLCTQPYVFLMAHAHVHMARMMCLRVGSSIYVLLTHQQVLCTHLAGWVPFNCILTTWRCKIDLVNILIIIDRLCKINGSILK